MTVRRRKSARRDRPHRGAASGNAPDDAAGGLADVLLTCREEGGVRAAVAQRNAEPLRAAERHVRAELARRSQQREAE